MNCIELGSLLGGCTLSLSSLPEKEPGLPSSFSQIATRKTLLFLGQAESNDTGETLESLGEISWNKQKQWHSQFWAKHWQNLISDMEIRWSPEQRLRHGREQSPIRRIPGMVRPPDAYPPHKTHSIRVAFHIDSHHLYMMLIYILYRDEKRV